MLSLIDEYMKLKLFFHIWFYYEKYKRKSNLYILKLFNIYIKKLNKENKSNVKYKNKLLTLNYFILFYFSFICYGLL